MTKYYCDYCDIFLTHDAPRVRKDHNAGWKHAAQVRAHYMAVNQDKMQRTIAEIVKDYGARQELVPVPAPMVIRPPSGTRSHSGPFIPGLSTMIRQSMPPPPGGPAFAPPPPPFQQPMGGPFAPPPMGMSPTMAGPPPPLMAPLMRPPAMYGSMPPPMGGAAPSAMPWGGGGSAPGGSAPWASSLPFPQSPPPPPPPPPSS